MKKVVKPKIIYKYVGDESPEKKEEAEKIMQEFYFQLFDKAAANLKEKKKNIDPTVNSEKRLEQLLNKFWERFQGNALLEIRQLIQYPGGIILINNERAGREGITGAARTVRMRSTKVEKIRDPRFEVRIVREKFDKYSDDEVFFIIAHELSHIVMNAGNSNWSEYAADVLADHFWGVKNPKGSRVGYLSED